MAFSVDQRRLEREIFRRLALDTFESVMDFKSFRNQWRDLDDDYSNEPPIGKIPEVAEEMKSLVEIKRGIVR